MLYLIIVALAVHLHYKLVQRVVVTLPHPHRPPGIAALHLPQHTHLLGLLAVSLLLGSILHLEQKPLLL